MRDFIQGLVVALVTASGATQVFAAELRRSMPSPESEVRLAKPNLFAERKLQWVKRFQAQKATTSKDGGSASTNSLGCELEPDDQTPCVPMFVVWDSFRFEDGGIEHEIFEKVEVSGSRVCTVEIVTDFGSSEVPCGSTASILDSAVPTGAKGGVGAQVVAGLKEAVEIVGPYITARLQQCAKTPPSNQIKTPDGDKAIGWVLAKDAIFLSAAGNLSSLRIGARVDVLYPSGTVKEFMFENVSTPKTPAEVKLVELPDPPISETPCKT